MYAIIWPRVMNKMLSVTKRPRCAEGESSEIYLLTISVGKKVEPSLSYKGATRLAPPIASPTILLPTIMPRTDKVMACHAAPSTNNTSAATMAFFLPHLSAARPARGLAIRAKRLVQDVIKLLSSVLNGRWDRSSPTETRVEDMTPVLGESQSTSR